MALSDWLKRGAGKAIDFAGSTFNLPELGLSERLGVHSEGDVFDWSGTGTPYTVGSVSPVDTRYGPTDTSYTAPTSSGSTSGGGTGTYYGSDGTALAYNPDDLAYLEDKEGLLRKLLARSGTLLDQGLTRLGDSFDRETGRVNTQQAETKAGYGTQREDTTKQKLSAVNQVNTNARTLSDSLRRILGLASGTASSAYRFAAPQAVARNASISRTGVNETYGRNFRNIDESERKSDLSFQEVLEDLARQRREKEEDLRGGVLESEQQTLANLADVARQKALLLGGGYDQVRAATAPLQGQIDERQSRLDQLFNRFRNPYTPKQAVVDRPELGDYTVDRAAISGQAEGQGQYSPYDYLSYLKRRRPEAV